MFENKKRMEEFYGKVIDTVVPKNAKNKENAMKWIDFLNRPEVAKQNFEYITYPTPNEAAYQLSMRI